MTVNLAEFRDERGRAMAATDGGPCFRTRLRRQRVAEQAEEVEALAADFAGRRGRPPTHAEATLLGEVVALIVRSRALKRNA